MMTLKPYENLKDAQVNGLLGLAGETGEVCDLLKKHWRGDGPLDKEKFMKELGDVMWYIAELCEIFGFTLEEVAQKNIEKLRARHGTSFSGVGNRTGKGK